MVCGIQRLSSIKDMLLSVLDQSPIAEGSTGAEALHNTLDLARLADRLGYHRYWVAEHHGGPMLAGPSPEVLIGPIAAATEGIRVGSGGVMLPHYSPLKVAESFTILAALYPGRIDLGLGRAAGTDPLTTFALQRDRRQAAPDDFPQQLAELLAYFEDDLPEDHPFRHLAKSLPGRPELPVPWLLGSSQQSAIWAAELGPALRVRRFHQPRRQPRSPSSIASASSPVRDLAAPAHGGRRLGAVRAHRRGGPAAGVQQPDDLHAAAPRPADRGAAAREGGGVPGPRGPGARRRTSRPPRRSSARPRRSGPASRSWPPSTAPTR